MDEIQLSSDLNVITAEINSYKQVAGQAIFEIGRRLKHVKENDLVHGEWQKYCEETLEMSRVYANRYITVYNEFKNSNVNTSFGLNKLFQIATLPPEEREKEHVTSKGEIKTVDEMTVRELQEVKRQLKQAEAQAETERKERERLERENEELANREPEKIEVIPDDYDKLKGGYSALEGTAKLYKEQNESLRNELKELENLLNEKQSSEADEELINTLKEEEENLKNKINELYKLHELQNNIEQLLSIILPSEHTINFNRLVNEYEMLDTFESTLDGLSEWCQTMKDKLPNKNIIEGVFTDE